MFFHRNTSTKRLENLKILLALCELNEKHMKSVNEYYYFRKEL